MIIYNITFQVEWKIYDTWIQWMQQEYIATLMSAEVFEDVKILRLLDVDEREGPTVAVQFTCASLEEFRKFQDEHAREYSRRLVERWNAQIVFFSSIMEIVQ